MKTDTRCKHVLVLCSVSDRERNAFKLIFNYVH